jgi:hypothetical protein
MRAIVLTAALLLTLAPLSARADPPLAASSGSTTVAPVTVPGKLKRTPALEKQINTYVKTVLAHTPERRVMSWRDPICPLVGGLPTEQGEYVLARFTEVMQEVGAPLAPEKCHVNLFVVVTDDPERLLEVWYKHDPGMYGAAHRRAIDIFIETRRPVRAWYNAHLGKAGGIPFAVSTGTYGTTIQNNHVDDSRLTRNDELDADSVLIVLDARRLQGIKLQQVADYALMVGLTEIDPDARFADAPSILNLFEKDAPQEDGMTGWDKSFLAAIYHSDTTSVMQRDLIVDRILNDVTQ